MGVASDIACLGRQALDGWALDRPSLMRLASLASGEPHELMYWAHRVRVRHFGKQVSFCSIVPGKVGGCGEDCKWCAQSAGGRQTKSEERRAKGEDRNDKEAPYAERSRPQRTEMADIQGAAADADRNTVGCFSIVNSGRRPSTRDLGDVAAAFRSFHEAGVDSHGMRLAVSLGELTPEAARQLVQSGVRRYHHNLETSRRYYGQVVTSHSYDDRLRTLRIAREAGMEICCGGLMGMGETWEDRMDLALTLRDEAQASVCPLNFLQPIPGTALEAVTPMPPLEILATIALFRLAMPTTDLKIAGGRHVNLRDLQSWMFYAGATSLLVGNYLTTSGRPVELDIQMVRDLGLELVRQVTPRK